MRAEPFGPLVVFTLANEKWALPASVVQRAVRAVEITPCPDAPDVVLGVINVHGRIIPVFDLRRRFGLPLRELSIDDHIIIAKAETRSVAILVDAVCGMMQPDESAVLTKTELPPELTTFDGILKLGREIVLIYDLDKFLSLEEEQLLAKLESSR